MLRMKNLGSQIVSTDHDVGVLHSCLVQWGDIHTRNKRSSYHSGKFILCIRIMMAVWDLKCRIPY